MLAGIADGGDLAVYAAVTEAARHQNSFDVMKQGGDVLGGDGLGIDPADIDAGMAGDTAVLQGFYHGDIGVMQLGVFADQGDSNLILRMFPGIDHGAPVFQIRFGAFQLQTFTGHFGQMFLFHSQGGLVENLHIQILQHMLFGDIAEEGDLAADGRIQRMLAAADNDIRPDSHALQILDTGLCGLGL